MLLLKRPQVELPGLMHCVYRLQPSVECVRGASMPPPRGWKPDSPKTLQGAAFSGPGGPATGLLCVPPAGSAGAFSRQRCPELPVRVWPCFLSVLQGRVRAQSLWGPQRWPLPDPDHRCVPAQLGGRAPQTCLHLSLGSRLPYGQS